MDFFSRISLIVIITVSGVFGQISISGDASSRVDSLINSMPAGSFTNEYQAPDYEQTLIWSEIINYLLKGDIASANNIAGGVGYIIIVFSDTSFLPAKTYYFLEKHPEAKNYWGTFVFNPNPLRSKIIIQAPHPLADTYTGRQGFDIFEKSGAFLYCVSGTHRCNSSDSTNCSGRTDICSGLSNAKYRKSDQAHSTESVFQITTEQLLKYQSDLIFIQPHGFARQTGDPDLILSNGTRRTPRYDFLYALKDSLIKMNPLLKFKLIHLEWNWNKLTGTTNTQGRLINGSLNPCLSNASETNGRFLHIEQAPYLRFPKNWYLLSNAIMKVFPVDHNFTELAYLNAVQEINNINVKWETIEEKGNYGFELQKRTAGNIDWSFVKFFQGHGSGIVYNYLDSRSGEEALYRLKQINTDGTYKLFPAIRINDAAGSGCLLFDNYPNPFNPFTTISFKIPEQQEVDLTIFNILGERVKTLVHSVMQQGIHKLQFDAGDLTAGIYFYRLSTQNYISTKKLILIK